MATLKVMGKKKPNGKDAPADRHKQRKLYAVREQFLSPLEQLAIRLGFNSTTELVNQIIRERLEREGLWPAKSDD
jgi:hypothetical protein